MKLNKRLISLLLALVMLAAVFAGCKGRDAESSTPDEDTSVSEASTPEEKEEPEVGTIGSITPDYLSKIADAKEENDDTVGWLRVPGTLIDDVVVCNFEDNQYYLRRNFQKEKDFYGIYYADRRSYFGDGSREQLGLNTCIYGHAMTDDEENANYNKMFGPLHDFRIEDIARETPYLFFSTETENLAFEIFAVFIANSDNTAVPYNRNDVEPEEFYKMIEEEIRPRSLYDYNVEIKEGDKFLTLSTCIYELPNGTATGYPNTYYRYAIMARLVDEDEPLKEEADFTINEDMVMDADGPWKNN